VACDLNPRRRELAVAMGADIVIDPCESSPYAPRADLKGRWPNVVYECVGKPGILNQIVDNIVPLSHIVMGGYCMDPEEIYVPTAQNKRLRITFAGGELPEDMLAARDAIAQGKVDLRPWLGEGIGLSGIEDALKRMSDPAEPIRRVVDPTRL
jgi:threonine dehydrogenase-like Zn-dependent dehydrogenase